MSNLKKWLIKICSITPFTKRLAVGIKQFFNTIRYKMQFMNKYPVNDKMVLFESFMGKQVSCSPKALYQELVNSPVYEDYIKVWALSNPSKFEELNQNKNTILVKYKSAEYYKYCATAKYWITNSRMPKELKPKKEQRYIQCWHGTPLKRLGYDIELYNGSKAETKELQNNYRVDAERYSAILSPSDFYREKITSAFNLKELGKESCFIQKGYPRNDFLYSHTSENIDQIKRNLSIPFDKKVILYAPTWRENQHKAGEGYTYDLGVDFDKLYKALKDDYVILFRAHYFVSNGFDFEKYKGFVIDVCNYSDVNHLYVVSDLLITDYSSVFFDYANLKRPMIFYMYDMDAYKDEMRGFYIDLEELPGTIVKKEEDLIKAIQSQTTDFVYDEVYEKFNAKFNPYHWPCSADVWTAILQLDNHTIDIVEKEKCSGCSACYNICPKDAISMNYDEEGFLFPMVDESLCVSCGLCQKVCPALEPYKENDTDPKVYIVKREEKYTKDSTSAGVFAALAEYVLEKNGYVCGAVYDEQFEVCHWITNTEDGVKRMKQSKYVQSQIGLIYREIKELLDKGELVLFSGTPCQISGIRKYLRNPYENLITFDIFCHGTPAPISWKRYLDENADREKIEDIDFRHKGDHGFLKHHICFSYKDGNKDVVKSSDNSYYYHFSRNLGLRNSCTHCQGAIVPRVGDFSAGDYWGAKIDHPELIESDKGISVLFVNNEAARKLFEQIKDKFNFIQEITVSESMKANRAEISRSMHPNRTRFFEMLKIMSLNDAVKKNVGRPFEIAIYGNTVSMNYGIMMAYYALYKVLHNMNYGVVMLPPPKHRKEEIENHAQRFMKKHVVLAPQKTLSKFHEYNRWGDIFLIGSDHVWNKKLFSHNKNSMYLDFVQEGKGKVAYASSFGNKPVFKDEEDKQKAENLLKDFDAISVVDARAAEIAKIEFNLDVKNVIDPIFLLEKEEYEKFANEVMHTKQKKNIAVYVLEEKSKLHRVTNKISEQLQLPCIYMGNGNYDKLKKQQEKSKVQYFGRLEVQAWLSYMMNSEFIITDSYYGVCFAILFQKNFVVIQNKIGLSLLEELLSKVELKERWFETTDQLLENMDILDKEIDYEHINALLKKEKENSVYWLKTTLDTLLKK